VARASRCRCQQSRGDVAQPERLRNGGGGLGREGTGRPSSASIVGETQMHRMQSASWFVYVYARQVAAPALAAIAGQFDFRSMSCSRPKMEALEPPSQSS
jgi:hypothetical protein